MKGSIRNVVLIGALFFFGVAGRMLAVQGQAAPPASAAASPASQTPPPTATPQSYAQEQIDAGQAVFLQNCAFCHGRDAGGGETGPDLTRSNVVAVDVRGDQIAPIVHGGRTDKGMPAFNLSDQDLAAVVAFIHEQKNKADTEQGGRQHVTPSDLQTGNTDAGKAFFDGAGKCATCHSPTGDLAGIGSRFQGLSLLQRMLYPTGRGVGPTTKVTVTLPAGGGTVTGTLAYRDEFTIAIRDISGKYRSWPTDRVKFTVDDPIQAHADLLGKYTDQQMHDVFAYIETLK